MRENAPKADIMVLEMLLLDQYFSRRSYCSKADKNSLKTEK